LLFLHLFLASAVFFLGRTVRDTLFLSRYSLAALPWMQSLAFGLMDFVSDHHGALGAAVMRSPGQFEHQLIVRAKAVSGVSFSGPIIWAFTGMVHPP
ncbi:MAG: hypothetical protein B7Z62_05735, partial [Deltaproteobacteria bacterium 37-65-8]